MKGATGNFRSFSRLICFTNGLKFVTIKIIQNLYGSKSRLIEKEVVKARRRHLRNLRVVRK